jgi:hypothetical protein
MAAIAIYKTENSHPLIRPAYCFARAFPPVLQIFKEMRNDTRVRRRISSALLFQLKQKMNNVKSMDTVFK